MADSNSRDQVLADFQACTGLDDIETSIAILEQNGWDLMEAVSSFMPNDAASADTGTHSQSQPAMGVPLHSTVEEDLAEIIPGHVGAMAAGASGWPDPLLSNLRQQRNRLINFHVEFRDRNIPVVLPDTETIRKIKETLEAELGIPVIEQELRGFPSRRVTDDKILRDLSLPKDNTLYLLTPNSKDNQTVVRATQSTSSESANERYSLEITVKDNSLVKLHRLQFPGNKTIQEIKTALYHITDIPVRYQRWSGWPESASDDMMLMSCGISYPTHILEIARVNAPNRSSSSGTSQGNIVEPIEIDISEDEEDIVESYPDEDFMIQDDDMTQARKTQLLIPESVVDTTDALEHFSKEFRQRYGDMCPQFFIGPLDQAVRNALDGKAKDRKPLAIYLHHDSSISSNVFCSQVLCSESVVSLLSNEFVVWGWDLTNETNKKRLISMATQHFGSIAAGQIRSYRIDQLPALLIVSRTRATNEVVDVIQGHVMIDEIMTRLFHTIEIFRGQQDNDVQDEQERDQREQIKKEQDDAYEESLLRDQKKLEAQREEEKKKQEQFESEMKVEQEKEEKRKEESAMKEAISKSLANEIPPEPPADCKEAVSNLRIRVPGGETINRKFLASETLQVLMNFLVFKGFHLSDHKVLTTYPRRDISQLDISLTLKEVNLFPQETLILEER